MSTSLYNVNPTELKVSEPLGLYNSVSFKDWVDNKYSDTNLIVKYKDPEEMKEFLEEVVACSEKYNKIIIPEYESGYIPEMDLTRAVIKGNIIGSYYYAGNSKMPAIDFLNFFIKEEIINGDVSLKNLCLINILST